VRLAGLVHYALQLVLLVLRQLVKPVGVRLVQGIVKGGLLVVGELPEPSGALVPHFSVVADTGQIPGLSLSEQPSEERPKRPACATRVARTCRRRGRIGRSRCLCIDRPGKRN
jgi:hypothetical protein